MTDDDKERAWTAITSSASTPLSDKDVEFLEKIVRSQPFILALGKVYAQAYNLPVDMLSLDLSEAANIRRATHIQGQIQGMISAINILLELAIPQEEEESGDTE